MNHRLPRILIDQGPQLAAAAAEYPGPAGQLITPLTQYADQHRPFAIENGCFTHFHERTFFRLLIRQQPHRRRCLFVNAPDVPFCWPRTLALFNHYRPQLAEWPLAITLQNGLDPAQIPWPLIRFVFIGGDDAFKYSPAVAAAIAGAHSRGKGIHVGRLNTPERFQHFVALRVTTFDGQGVSRYTHMRRELLQPLLFTTQTPDS